MTAGAREVLVKARTGAAFEVRPGQRFRIVDVQGKQVSDLVAFSQGLKTGRGVTETERNGTAAREITALYQALWARDGGEAAGE